MICTFLQRCFLIGANFSKALSIETANLITKILVKIPAWPRSKRWPSDHLASF